MLLYITRKYPPSIGGMQRFNFKLVVELKKLCDVCLISWGKSQAYLPFFLAYAFLKAFVACCIHKIDVIYVSDGLLSVLGVMLKYLFNIPVAVTIHGRDIVFDNRIYQSIIPKCLCKLDKVICVSQYLQQQCLKRGVPGELIQVIPNGISVSDFMVQLDAKAKMKIEDIICTSLWNGQQKRQVLISVARLVPKKGIDYFISTILPTIVERKPDIFYFIVGDGPLRGKIEQLIAENNLGKNVHLFGNVSMMDDLLPMLYKAADIFVMPNVFAEGDAEGFGIVALEACAAGLPVVASDLEGIREAVHNGENGLLIEPGNKQMFVAAILKLLNDPRYRRAFGKKAKAYVRGNYDWTNIANMYLRSFDRWLLP